MLLIAWTTVANQADATRLASGLIAQRLATCVQIDGPVVSHYIWEGKVECAQEYRLTIKFLPAHARTVQSWIEKNHPYEIPEWVVARAEDVSEKYLSWARSNCTPAPFNKSQSLF